MLIEQNLVELL